MNDNGSGSSSVLELAIQMARQGITPHNKVTFAWWGAEELGLIGSRAYVRSIVNTTVLPLFYYYYFLIFIHY